MTDPSWTFRTKSNGDIPVDAVLGSAPEAVRGETTEVRVLVERGRLGGLTTDGFTYSNDPTTTPGGGTDTGATWGGAAGAVYGGQATAAVDRYERLRSFLDYAGQAARGRDIDGNAWYREQLPARADVSSSVVGFDPSSDLGDINGLWGLVVGGVDESSGTGAFVLSFRVFVLGEYSDYADHAAVANDLEA